MAGRSETAFLGKLPKRLLGRLFLMLVILFGASLPVWGQRPGPDIRRWVPPQTVPVPNLLGQTKDQAAGTLRHNGLGLGTVTSQNSNQPKDTIVRQDPAAGDRVLPGKAVNLWLSTGPPPTALVRVPNLVGKKEPQARGILATRRLQLGMVEGDKSMAPPGTILRQDPAAGQRVQPQKKVDVWVSLGPTRVPNVVGQNEGGARDLLARARLHMELADRQQGAVVEQNPKAGQRVPMGSSVKVWRAAIQVQVPSLIGRRENEAAAILSPANLHPGQVTRRDAQEPAGTIIGQNPAPGTQVVPPKAVDLTISTVPPPPKINVPNVLGKPLDDAKSTLAGAHLTTGRVEERESGQPAGTVTHQDPAPGTRVEAGRPVSLVVAQKPIAIVPDLRGKPLEEAKRRLSEAGLTTGTVEEKESGQAAGTVTQQRPAPGTEVEAGHPVNLVVAMEIPPVQGSKGKDSGGISGGLWPPSRRTIYFVLAFAGVLAVGYLLYRIIPRPLLIQKVRAVPGVSTAEVATVSPRLTDHEVRLRPVIDQGRHEIDVAGPLIQEERQENE